jgi:ribosomal protein S27E
MLDDDMEIVCPQCGGTDIVNSSVTVRVMPNARSFTAALLPTHYEEHKNVPVIRCQGCNNIAFRREALGEIIPEINGAEIEDVEFFRLPAGFHERN